jgi:hypothetical protein
MGPKCKIYLSYQRSDLATTRRLHDGLEQQFGKIDLHERDLRGGDNFYTAAEKQVAACDVFLVAIDKSWLETPDNKGGRPPYNPSDFVRFEIAAALRLRKHIIPVLINDIQRPSADSLLEPLKPLAEFNAVRLSDDRFGTDMQALRNGIEAALAQGRTASWWLRLFTGVLLFPVLLALSFIALAILMDTLRVPPSDVKVWTVLGIAATSAALLTWAFVRKRRTRGAYISIAIIAGLSLICTLMAIFWDEGPPLRDGAGRPESLHPGIGWFPWPPPAPSSSYAIPTDVFAKYKTVGEVADAIIWALESCGYVERNFYTAENGGVVLVTRLEAIAADGTPLNPPERWTRAGVREDGVASLVWGLFFARPGYYRVIVFVIGGRPFAKGVNPATEEEATSWLTKSVDRLPPEIARLPYDSAEGCTALIYEFEAKQERQRSIAERPGRIPAKIHLERSGLLAAFHQTSR